MPAAQTSDTERLSREQLADRLEALAAAFREEELRVAVGNKAVGLSPPEEVNYRIDVVERSRRLRGDRETITIELDWQP
ncbi:amphi-Trp domain-containing protein [Natronorarus salvus]|uniref:amphi-Trp domain-containing protein n=1 Tax=Natronorarus salvus TaxID=3117733 RepID=UPI002F2675B7